MNRRLNIMLVMMPLAIILIAVALVQQLSQYDFEPAPFNPDIKHVTAGDEFINAIGIKLLAVPGGEFVMGSDDPKHPEESPPHKVTIQPFLMGKYEVTQEQWNTVMPFNPSVVRDPVRPVEQITWADAHRFIKALNARENTHKYRLPTEAEWEYVAQQGQAMSQNPEQVADQDLNRLKDSAWIEENSQGTTHAVGAKEPNALGFYDMLGNVWEWTQDCWHDDYQQAPTDGSAWTGGDCHNRILRGGAWDSALAGVRISARGSAEPYTMNPRQDVRDRNTGFRLVRSY